MMMIMKEKKGKKHIEKGFCKRDLGVHWKHMNIMAMKLSLSVSAAEKDQDIIKQCWATAILIF